MSFRLRLRAGRATIVRYAVLLMVSVAAALVGYRRSLHTGSDWGFFNVGARVLTHYQNRPLYGDPRLHLYVDNPSLQIGPPPIELVAAFYWMDSRTLVLVFALVMAVLGVVAFGCLERVALTCCGDRTTHVTARWWASAVLVTATWAYYGGAWMHLDDAMALTFAAAAVLSIARRRSWVLVGLLMGTAAACKPWAIVLAPVVLALPRKDRAPAVLVLLAAGAFWWAPFVVAAPGTIASLGQYHVIALPGSVLHLFGVSGDVSRWLRPVQIVLGVGVGALLVRRRRWLAAPLGALAVRVGTDAYTFPYYALGPVLFAFLWDATNRRSARLQFGLTAVTVAALCVASALLDSPQVEAGIRLAWVVLALACVFRGKVTDNEITRLLH